MISPQEKLSFPQTHKEFLNKRLQVEDTWPLTCLGWLLLKILFYIKRQFLTSLDTLEDAANLSLYCGMAAMS